MKYEYSRSVYDYKILKINNRIERIKIICL